MGAPHLPLGKEWKHPIFIPWDEKATEIYDASIRQVLKALGYYPGMPNIWNKIAPVFYAFGANPPEVTAIEEFLDWVRDAYRAYGYKSGKAEKAVFLRYATRVTLGVDENGWYEEFKGLRRYLPQEAKDFLDLLCEYTLTGDERKRAELEDLMARLIDSDYFYAPYEARGFAALVNYWKELRESREKTEVDELHKLAQEIVISY